MVGIPLDNGVVGEPDLICGSRSMVVNFKTKSRFEGNVYVKNYYARTDCKFHGETGEDVATIELPFDTCGLTRQRTVSFYYK